jgi:hypothetical protein
VGADPHCCHKSADDEAKIGHRHPILEGQDWAHSFGFGCIYFPQTILRRYLAERRPSMSDSRFSDWHIDHYGTVAVTWDVRPQHLHGD